MIVMAHIIVSNVSLLFHIYLWGEGVKKRNEKSVFLKTI